MGQPVEVVNGWVSPTRYRKTEMRRAKRYAHCHFAHSSRWDGAKRNTFWTNANCAIFLPKPGKAKRDAHYHFCDSSVLKQHFGVLMFIENHSGVDMAVHAAKQNNQNNWAKHAKICTCIFLWKKWHLWRHEKKRRVKNEWESLSETASCVADNASQNKIVKI